MGYQALLFCPDEKTARTVTQVLSELEFNVDSCTEPFAAVKKLMGQHFDAVVVDCDNEQNATLLFKSARNSTSNQASLAVAVVEGQAGVAKAFRIGANLVLTKPINIEQAKGTLRVARGLLRKSEPPKPLAPQAATPSAIAGSANTVSPAKLQTPAVEVTAVPVSLTQAKPDARPASPAPAVSSRVPAQGPLSDDDLLEISTGNSATGSSVPPAFTPTSNKFITPAPQADKSLATAAAAAAAKPNISSGLPTATRSGAASASAPARERQDNRSAEVSERPTATDISSKQVASVPTETSSLPVSASAAVPSFSFGGANTSPESAGGSKKIFLGIVAAALIAVAAYASWAHFQGASSTPNVAQTASNPVSAPVPVAIPQTARPNKTSVSTSAKPSATLPISQTASNQKGHAPENGNLAQDELASSATSTKASKPGSSASKEAADAADDSETPLVVKGGKTPGRHAKVGVADVAAPSIIGIATAGGSAPPPDLGSGTTVAPKPVLQTMTVSQGVSRGLLVKKVQPVYPRNALYMRIEGAVELVATIAKTGDITHVKVVSGDSELAKAAVTAVKQWKYKPYLLNGEPLEIQTQITINFKLPN